eukprot:m.430669 g.430669  ORF g.430669 m.430669 type:complete len:182 (+) comp17199_c0_seq1:132-677(+)
MLTLLVLTALVGGVAADGVDGYLLAAKEFANEVVVSGRDLTIKYTLHNVGDSAIVDVTLADEEIAAGSYEVVSGLTTVKFASIAPGASVSHSLVVRPQLTPDMKHSFSGAKVTYKASATASRVQVATTSAPGLVTVESYESFARKTSPHYAEWATFLMLCVVPLGIPYYQFTTSRAKYPTA